jgi:hypothetical protein
MSAGNVAPAAVREYVRERVGDDLRAVAVYCGENLDVRYVREDLGSDPRERFADFHAAVLSAYDAPEEMAHCWGVVGPERASLQIREAAAILHVRPAAASRVRAGVLVELDPSAARDCAGFMAGARDAAIERE